MDDYLDRLARFARELAWEALPEPVRDQARLVLMDTCGVIVAGSARPEVRRLADQGAGLAPGNQATLLGQGRRASLPVAALVNGTAAVSLELDEGNQYAINHPAAHLLPATLALVEARADSGRALLEALVAGYEVAVRIGRATRLRDGVHPFGTYAVCGAAVAAARLLGLDAPEIARAIEAAVGTVVVSSQSAATSGATIRNVYTGLTNLGGLLGPCLTRAGFDGEPGAADVTFGRLLGDQFAPALVVEELGQRWFITQNYFKLHACSRWNHAPIEAMAHIRERIDPDRVEAIVVETYNPATRLSRQLPPNWFGAKHSIAFNVVARLLFGRNDAAIYTDEVVRDPRVQALCQRVELREDAALTALVPDVRAARVRVRMAGGEEIVGFEDHAPGGFDRPYPRERLERKFLELTGPVLGGAASQQGMRMCLEADVLADATALAAALAGSPAPGADPS